MILAWVTYHAAELSDQLAVPNRFHPWRKRSCSIFLMKWWPRPYWLIAMDAKSVWRRVSRRCSLKSASAMCDFVTASGHRHGMMFLASSIIGWTGASFLTRPFVSRTMRCSVSLCSGVICHLAPNLLRSLSTKRTLPQRGPDRLAWRQAWMRIVPSDTREAVLKLLRQFRIISTITLGYVDFDEGLQE